MSRCNALLKVLLLSSLLGTAHVHANAQSLTPLNITIKLPTKKDIQTLPNFATNQIKNSPQERSNGRLFFTTIKQHQTVFQDLTLQQYISSLGNLLVDNASIPQPNYTFFIVNDPSINAFAGPAEYIGIHSGLILQSDSEAELASVLAHEIAHQKLQHLHRLGKQVSNNPLTNPLLIAGIIIAGIFTQNTEISVASTMFAVGKGLNQNLAHSREFESEADRAGLVILTNSNFSGIAATNLLKKLQTSQRNSLVYLRTHPLSSKRIRELQNLIKQPKPIKFSEEFALMQARIYALNKQPSPHLSKLQKHYRDLVEMLALRQLKAFDTLWNKYPEYQQKTHFQLLNVSRHIKQKNHAETAKILAELRIKIPNHLRFIYQQIMFLLQQNKAKQALDILHKQREIHPLSHHAYLWQMFQLVYQKMQRRLEAIEARARATFYQGYVRESLGLLDDAILIAEKQHKNIKVLDLKNLYNDYHEALQSNSKTYLKSPHKK